MNISRFVVALLFVVTACWATAQTKLRGRSPVGMLTSRQVIVDLGIKPDQQEKITTLQQEFVMAYVEALKVQATNAEEAQIKLDLARDLIEKRLLQVLNKKQLERRSQLTLQLGFPDTLLNSPFAELLKITSAQKESIDKISDEYRAAVSKLDTNHTDFHNQRNQHRKTYLAKAEKLLNADQTKILVKLKGKPLAN